MGSNHTFRQTQVRAVTSRADRHGHKLQESNKRGLEKDRNAIAREKFLAKYRKVENV